MLFPSGVNPNGTNPGFPLGIDPAALLILIVCLTLTPYAPAIALTFQPPPVLTASFIPTPALTVTFASPVMTATWLSVLSSVSFTLARSLRRNFMTITQLALSPDLTIGDDPAVYQFDLTLNNEVVAIAQPATVIKVCIRAIGSRVILVPAATATVTAGSPTTGKWSVIFSNTKTLLQNPEDLTSPMHKDLLKYPDSRVDDVSELVTGFCKAFFELQVGAPYQKQTITQMGYIGHGSIA